MEEKQVQNKIRGKVSNCGTHLYYPVKYKYDEAAKCHVPYFDTPVDMYQMIQASKASVDINTIVNRYTNGDVTVLHLGEKPFGDVSNVPDNLNDLNQFNREAVNSFVKLDPQIRALFDNDLNKFTKAINDGSYIDVISNALKVKDKASGESAKASDEPKKESE